MSIGAIAVDLTDVVDADNFSTIVAGTGRFSSFGPTPTDDDIEDGETEGGTTGRILISHDNGNSWLAPQANGLNVENITAITIERSEDPVTGDPTHTIVVASSEGGGGLFRSTDGGVNFSPVAGFTAGGATNILAMVADPTTASREVDQPGRLYAVAQGAETGLFRSNDFGENWVRIDNSNA